MRVEPAALGRWVRRQDHAHRAARRGAALALRRPVRIALTPARGLRDGEPGARVGVRGARRRRRDGPADRRCGRGSCSTPGAFAESSLDGIASILVARAVYDGAAWDIRAYGVRTNRVGTGSYRGPGGPQASFAIESLLDQLAAKLGMDAIELRRRNVRHARRGDGRRRAVGAHRGSRGAWPRSRTIRCGASGADLPPDEGVGIGLGVWPGGRQPAAAVCRLEPDGTLTVVTGVVDMTGVATGFATIAAEVFGVDPAA